MQLVYVQILRAIAALSVVIYHSLLTGKATIASQSSAFFSTFYYGDRGVDLFFVISGFIMVYTTANRNMTPWAFFRKRVERIVPLYWTIIFTLCVVSLLMPNAFRSTEWINFWTVTKSMFFISFISSKSPVVYIGWSLEYEMFFYVLIALFLRLSNIRWASITIIFSGLVCLGLWAAPDDNSLIAEFFTNPIILEFLFGIMIAQVYLSRAVPPIEWIAVGATMGLLLILHPENRAITSGPPAAALVCVGLFLNKLRRPSKGELLLAKLGDASYSIYLVQIFTVSATCKAIAKFLPQMPLDGLVAISFVIGAAAGYAVYALVETPLIRLVRTTVTQRRLVIDAAGVPPPP